MANPSDHLTQWKHNRDLISLIPRTHPDWIVTVAFYAALHIVDAVLSRDKVGGINNHDARNSVLRTTNKYEKINRSYRSLYTLSRTVRYLAQPAKWIPVNDIESQVLGHYLHAIEKSAEGLLGLSLELTKITLSQ